MCCQYIVTDLEYANRVKHYATMKLLKRDRERMKLTLSEIQRLVSVGWTPGLVDKDRDGNVCSIDRRGLSVSPR